MDPATPAPRRDTPSDAETDLLHHFPGEVTEAYARLRATGDPEAADRVVLAVVVDFLPDKGSRPGSSLGDSLTLGPDLGFDSMAVTEMIFFLEDLFHIGISNEEIAGVRTVGDLKAFVRRKLESQPVSGPSVNP